MKKPIFLKSLQTFSLFDCIALLMLCIAATLRIILVASGWTATNSDEASYQLEALHILTKGELPIFLYGQSYMGTIEAYVGAGLFKIFGPSVFVMRMEIIVFYVLFLFLLYRLTTHLYSKAFALSTISFLSMGTAPMLQRQIESTGGIPEINIFEVALFLIVTRLTLHQGTGKVRCLLYVFWGTIVGLALWSDVLITPYLLMAGALLATFHWRELLKWAIWPVIAGMIIGGYPLIYYNLTCPPGANSISIFMHLYSMGTSANDSIQMHLMNTALVSLPVMTGLHINNFLRSYPSSQPHAFRLLLIQMGWSGGYCLLLLCTVGLAIGTLWSIKRHKEIVLEVSQQEQFRQCARLALAFGALLTLYFYVKGSASIVDNYNSARYLSILWISTPAVLWPLWNSLLNSHVGARALRIPHSLFCFPILLMIFVICLQSTINTFGKISQAQTDQRRTSQLAQTLEYIHMTRFYTDYWTCNRLIFETQEQLICGDTWGGLTHGFDRYKPYRVMVNADPNPGFVYPKYSERVQELEKALASTHTAYQRMEVNNYIIYRPTHRIVGIALYQN